MSSTHRPSHSTPSHPAPHDPSPSDHSGAGALSRRGLLGAAAATAATAGLGAAPAALAAPSAPEVQPRAEAAESSLSRPDRAFLAHGLMHGAWLRSGSQDDWIPSAEQWALSGFNAPTFYNPPLYSQEVMDRAGSPLWSLAKGPRGEHLEAPPTDSGPLLPAEAHAAADTLLTACFGDEEAFSEERLGWLVQYYERMHRDYPHVLVHNNQAVGQYPDAEMRRYIAEAQPDLLTFDFYYFHQAVQYPGGSVSSLYRLTARYRRLALEGLDGKGGSPLAFGQYTTGFKLHPDVSPDDTPVSKLRVLYVSESQQMVVSHVTWAMGGKWLDLFRWERGPEQEDIYTDGQFLNHPDGTPTPQFHRYARLNRTMRAYSPYLTRLRSRAVALDHGIVAETGEPTPAANEVHDFSAQTDPATGVVGLAAENLGTVNGGQRGDVLLGTFRALPGMTAAENDGVLPDPATTVAFMLVNTLVWRNDDWTEAEGTGGGGEETQQRITVTIDTSAAPAGAAVHRVDPDSGELAAVTLAAADGGTQTFSVDLLGGESGLYLWV